MDFCSFARSGGNGFTGTVGDRQQTLGEMSRIACDRAWPCSLNSPLTERRAPPASAGDGPGSKLTVQPGFAASKRVTALMITSDIAIVHLLITVANQVPYPPNGLSGVVDLFSDSRQSLENHFIFLIGTRGHQSYAAAQII